MNSHYNEYSVFLKDIYEKNVPIKVTDQNLASKLSKVVSKLNNGREGKNLMKKIIL